MIKRNKETTLNVSLDQQVHKVVYKRPSAPIFTHNSENKFIEKLESRNESVEREFREEGSSEEDLRSSSLEDARKFIVFESLIFI